jgi:voltage-gated potassium channel
MIRVLFGFFRSMHRVTVGRPAQTAFLFTSLVLYAASGYMCFELPVHPDLTWSDAFWWTVVTMTTVGYGDLFPTTLWGRVLVGFPTMLLGVGMLGYVLSLVASAMFESKAMENKGMKRIIETGHIIICNYVSDERIMELIRELRRDTSTRDRTLILIDNDLEELPSDLRETGIQFVRGDAASEETLSRANLCDCHAVIIQADPHKPAHSDNRNLKIGLTIEHLCASVYTIVECIDPENEIYFKRVNCDSVVCIAALAGRMMVQELQDPGVGSIVEELTSNEHGKQFYVQAIAGSYPDYASLSAAYVEQPNCVLLGIRRGGDNHLLPDSDFLLEPTDKAILVAAGRAATSS